MSKKKTKRKRQQVDYGELAREAELTFTLHGDCLIRMADHHCERVDALNVGDEIMAGLPDGQTVVGEIADFSPSQMARRRRFILSQEDIEVGECTVPVYDESDLGFQVLGVSQGLKSDPGQKDYSPIASVVAIFVCLGIDYAMEGDSLVAYLDRDSRVHLLSYALSLNESPLREGFKSAGAGSIDRIKLDDWESEIIFKDSHQRDPRCRFDYLNTDFGGCVLAGSRILCPSFFRTWNKRSVAKFIVGCFQVLGAVSNIRPLVIVGAREDKLLCLIGDLLNIHFGVVGGTSLPQWSDSLPGTPQDSYQLLYRSNHVWWQIQELFKIARDDYLENTSPYSSLGLGNPFLKEEKSQPEYCYEWDFSEEWKDKCFFVRLKDPEQSICKYNGLLIGPSCLRSQYSSVITPKPQESVCSKLKRAGY